MTVEIIADIQLQNAAFKVYDLTGRMVRKELFSGNTFQFSRNDMTAGMYVYLIEMDGQKVSSGKMVVQ